MTTHPQVPPMKCRVRNAGPDGVTRVDVYDEIGGGGWMSDGISAGDFAAQMMPLRGPLDVHINSAGGDVGDGLAIMNTIRDHQGPVRTVVDGIAASIASVIAQAGQERVVRDGAMLMIHDAWACCIGNAADMAKTADDLDKHSDNIASIYAKRAGHDAAFWRAQMAREPWYTAEEAVAAGLADKIGEDRAALPEGLDLAALGSVPGRIAARLRSMPTAAFPQPQDAARHEPMKGTHSHPHPAYGSQGGDSLHSHERSHASHSHSHAAPDDGDGGDGPQDSAAGEDCPTCEGTGKIMEGHRDCPDCDGTGKKKAAAAALTAAGMTLDDIRSLIRSEIQAADGKADAHGHPGKPCWDPDGDGDCDQTAEGDTDHDYWTAGGEQIKSVPGKPVPDKALTLEDIRAAVREELASVFGNADGVDNSAWDASKAWHNGAESDDPAAFYAGICAGKKAGDKSTQDAWALPYKYTPSSPVNAAGVKAALSRLPQTEGLTNEAEARALLQRLMKQVNPDYEPEDSAGGGPQDSEDDLSGADLEQMRTAFKALRGAVA